MNQFRRLGYWHNQRRYGVLSVNLNLRRGKRMDKHILQSRTIWGVILMLVSGVVPSILPPEQVPAALDTVLMLIGAGWAVYGRVNASMPVRIKRV